MSEDIRTRIGESDYRAILAFMWTVFTFALIGYTIYRGQVDANIIGFVGTILTLDAVFINSYFKSKE